MLVLPAHRNGLFTDHRRSLKVALEHERVAQLGEERGEQLRVSEPSPTLIPSSRSSLAFPRSPRDLISIPSKRRLSAMPLSSLTFRLSTRLSSYSCMARSGSPR